MQPPSYLALYTFGMFLKPSDDPANDYFHQLNDEIMAAVDQAQGLIARSGYASDPGPEPWGEEVYPEFYVERGDGWSPATLSLWQDMESLFNFTYFDLHAAAFKRGREWFELPQWPPLVLWWHEGSEFPTWSEGVRRHKLLHEQGSSIQAFTFKQAFDRAGNPVKLNKSRLQDLREFAD